VCNGHLNKLLESVPLLKSFETSKKITYFRKPEPEIHSIYVF
jgi:hypothetical protein